MLVQTNLLAACQQLSCHRLQADATEPAARPQEDADELQQLMQQYDSQAARDAQAALAASQAKRKAVSQMGMAELRSEGLAKPLDADNR